MLVEQRLDRTRISPARLDWKIEAVTIINSFDAIHVGIGVILSSSYPVSHVQSSSPLLVEKQGNNEEKELIVAVKKGVSAVTQVLHVAGLEHDPFTYGMVAIRAPHLETL